MYRTTAARAIGLLSIAALTAMATSAGAQSAMGTVSAADRAFMMNASEANIGEIASGTLAEERGSTSTVRRLGKRFVDGHRSNQQQLSMLAQRLSVTLPTHPSTGDRMAMARLEQLHGRAFDDAFLGLERNGDVKNITASKAEIGSSSSASIVAYAKASLPVFEEHLLLATDDVNRLHAAGSTNGGTSRMNDSSGLGAPMGVTATHGDVSGSSTGNGPGAENASGTGGGAATDTSNSPAPMKPSGTSSASATGNGPGAANASGAAGGARTGKGPGTNGTNPAGDSGSVTGPGANNASGTEGGAVTTNTPPPGR